MPEKINYKTTINQATNVDKITRRYKRNALMISSLIIAASFKTEWLDSFEFFKIKPGNSFWLPAAILLLYHAAYYYSRIKNRYVQLKHELILHETGGESKRFQSMGYALALLPTFIIKKFFDRPFSEQHPYVQKLIPESLRQIYINGNHQLKKETHSNTTIYYATVSDTSAERQTRISKQDYSNLRRLVLVFQLLDYYGPITIISLALAISACMAILH